ncbi:peregrin-like isoform x1 [Dermatophagoides farinae]|uniref:Peregrin-like isoform x1 n=1 Tax=Dermatophagoides farinae TaxID=6954 RepID=A0A9D4SGA2_DERFA|nr:peregrin-like isoform x1 [Dermatophagoides farinae]
MPSTNISLYLESIRSSKAPYYCPFQNCGKSFRKIDAIKMHLNNIDHAEISPTFSSTGRRIMPTTAAAMNTNEKRSTTTRDLKNNDHEKRIRMIQFKYKCQLVTIPAETNMKMRFISMPKVDNADTNNSAAVDEKKPKNRKSKNKSISKASATATTTTTITNLKLPEPSYRLLNSADNDYKEPSDSLAAYYRFLDDSIEEEDQMKVEYDMDEEDAVWLEMINKKRREDRLLDVNVETFELIMDRFEKESFFQSQNCGADISSAIDEDAVCSICFDGECHNSNAILFCDMCNIAVHQECYGVPYIPEGLWLCRRCLRSPSTAVDCVLCPNKGGAFKHTDDNRWAHVICALWIPEVGFANNVFLEPVDSINAIPAARWKLFCSICHQRNVGACIQCYKSNCYVAFHVTCAVQAGLYMKIIPVNEITRQGNAVVTIKKFAYCLNHAPVTKNGCSNGLYLSGDEDSRSEPINNKNNKKSKSKNSRKIINDKRTSTSIISIPTIPNERLSKISELVSFPRRNEFMQRLYAYWKLKRQSRNGMSLLRRLQYTNSTMRIDMNKEKSSKRDYIKMKNQYKKLLQLRRDLERSRLLLELVRKRERIKWKIIRETRSFYTYKLIPYKMFLIHLLDKVVEKDMNQFFIEPVNVEEVPDYRDFIKNPMDLGTMRKKVDENQYISFDQFENDLNLIIDNCTFYNEKDTIWHKAALKLKIHIDNIIEENRKYLSNYDTNTGLHSSSDNQEVSHIY